MVALTLARSALSLTPYMSKPPGMSVLLLFFTTLGFSFGFVTPSAEDHRYNVGDHVSLFVNKVGPLNNPSETYHYYDLPFCRPDQVIRRKASLGEVLNGDCLTNALYELKFREDKIGETLCQKKLKGDEVAKFRNAVSNDFYFQMYYDDLPLWGFIGKVEDENWTVNENGPKYYLFKHVQFDALYNGNQIIEIRAFSDPNHVVDITEDVDISVKFTYSILWKETSTQFENRMDKYSRASLFPTHQQIRWFSFINSFVIIVLLMGLLTMIFMRHLKNDLRKFSGGDEEEDKEVGWKYIHGDVFRYPPCMSLFCAVLGTGTQLLIQAAFLFVLALLGVLYPYNRGALCTSLVVTYTLTSVVAGYTASSFYNQFVETGWKRSVLLSGTLYLGPLFVMVSILNAVAVSYGATAALPFGTIVVILLIYTFVTIPLLGLGGVIGYRLRSEFQAPCATKRCPREIPPLAWYRKTPGQMFLGGLLPFSAIILELHHLYASLWGYKIWTLPGILFIMFIILVLLTAMLSIGLTYVQLSVEDHEWWWRSLLRGGSTAIFMFGHCIYFYARSRMSGFMQFSFYFGYNACICYAVFLMLGTISFRASLMFVRLIYHAVKSE
ncbi:transmembrane 9 superfamily member 5-like [Vitis riparia]|uniref:transmembrane 9 superfamily member 5-like n=1 Tax=Vitis riparia TaxID=96939 RepID=UPI00155A10D4|nr:transmembrane 9 superfamily member 5-like [Vitis riparia]